MRIFFLFFRRISIQRWEIFFSVVQTILVNYFTQIIKEFGFFVMHGGNKFFMDGYVSFNIRGRRIKSDWAEDKGKNLDTLN